MKIKTRIRMTLICILFGYGIAAAQNPKNGTSYEQ